MNDDIERKQLVHRLTLLEASRDSWKSKNKDRYDEIKALKMRLKETQESRDRWKTDYNSSKLAIMSLKEIESKKNNVIAILSEELEELKKKKSQG